MISLQESGFDSHVSLMSAVVQYPRCVLLLGEKKRDYEEKMSTLAEKPLNVCV